MGGPAGRLRVERSREADLLALLLAVELDPGLGRVLAYLHDDGRMLQPTPWLAARLCGRPPVPFGGEGLLPLAIWPLPWREIRGA